MRFSLFTWLPSKNKAHVMHVSLFVTNMICVILQLVNFSRIIWASLFLYYACFIVWQPRRAMDTSTNWQSLFCCCTASMEQATDGAETAANEGLVSSWSENIFVSFCLRAPGYRLTLWCALRLLVGGAIQVPQLLLQLLSDFQISARTFSFFFIIIFVYL